MTNYVSGESSTEDTYSEASSMHSSEAIYIFKLELNSGYYHART